MAKQIWKVRGEMSRGISASARSMSMCPKRPRSDETSERSIPHSIPCPAGRSDSSNSAATAVGVLPLGFAAPNVRCPVNRTRRKTNESDHRWHRIAGADCRARLVISAAIYFLGTSDPGDLDSARPETITDVVQRSPGPVDVISSSARPHSRFCY